MAAKPRCFNCRNILIDGELLAGTISIKCGKCNKVNHVSTAEKQWESFQSLADEIKKASANHCKVG